MLQCGSDRITFQRQSATSLSTAGLRVAGLPPFESDAAFLSTVSKLLSSVIPTGFQVQPWRPQLATTDAPCADATVIGQASAGILYLRARVCYESKSATIGYASLFSHLSQVSEPVPEAQADAFVVGASPK